MQMKWLCELLGLASKHTEIDIFILMDGHYEGILMNIFFCRPSHLKTLLTSVDRHGQNALMLCANNNNPKLLTSLLKAGAPVNAQNAGGKTALMIACSNGDLDSAQLLDKHNADFLIKDK